MTSGLSSFRQLQRFPKNTVPCLEEHQIQQSNSRKALYTPNHLKIISRVTPFTDPEVGVTWSCSSGGNPSQFMHLVSHVKILQVNSTPISCTWHHTSTVSSVTPCLRLCTWGHVAPVSSVTPLFHLGSHIHRVQGVTPSRPCSSGYTSPVSSVTPPHQTLYHSLLGLSPGCPHISDPVPGLTCSWWPG